MCCQHYTIRVVIVADDYIGCRFVCPLLIIQHSSIKWKLQGYPPATILLNSLERTGRLINSVERHESLFIHKDGLIYNQLFRFAKTKEIYVDQEL